MPDEARPFMKGYTAIEGPMTEAVPLAAYTLYNLSLIHICV